jgi:hypothetical protein
MTRLLRAWGTLEPNQRLAALAALALLVTMFLPWYELQSLDPKTKAIDSHSISAFGDVSFVEAAVFLVAVGVLGLLFARAERRDFHMPGSDGLVVLIAGGWATLLIFYRVFSRPSGHGYPVGIEWGFFFAFVAAGALGFAGWRLRASATAEPPLVRTRPGRTARAHEEATTVDAHEDTTTTVQPRQSRQEPARPGRAAPRTQAGTTAQSRGRSRFPPPPSEQSSPGAEQLSFEDAPVEPDAD